MLKLFVEKTNLAKSERQSCRAPGGMRARMDFCLGTHHVFELNRRAVERIHRFEDCAQSSWPGHLTCMELTVHLNPWLVKL